MVAAYHIQKATERFEFGRGGGKQSRRQTKFLFYVVVVDLLRHVLVREQKPSGPKDVTRAFLKLFDTGNEEAAAVLLDNAVNAIDEYMTPDTEDCVYREPKFVNEYENDLNAFLKWEQLGKDDESCPRFRALLAGYRKVIGKKQGSDLSDREKIAKAIG